MTLVKMHLTILQGLSYSFGELAGFKHNYLNSVIKFNAYFETNFFIVRRSSLTSMKLSFHL